MTGNGAYFYTGLDEIRLLGGRLNDVFDVNGTPDTTRVILDGDGRNDLYLFTGPVGAAGVEARGGISALFTPDWLEWAGTAGNDTFTLMAAGAIGSIMLNIGGMVTYNSELNSLLLTGGEGADQFIATAALNIVERVDLRGANGDDKWIVKAIGFAREMLFEPGNPDPRTILLTALGGLDRRPDADGNILELGLTGLSGLVLDEETVGPATLQTIKDDSGRSINVPQNTGLINLTVSNHSDLTINARPPHTALTVTAPGDARAYPSILVVGRDSGPNVAGNMVRIVGSNLDDVTSVRFGDLESPSFVKLTVAEMVMVDFNFTGDGAPGDDGVQGNNYSIIEAEVPTGGSGLVHITLTTDTGLTTVPHSAAQRARIFTRNAKSRNAAVVADYNNFPTDTHTFLRRSCQRRWRHRQLGSASDPGDLGRGRGDGGIDGRHVRARAAGESRGQLRAGCEPARNHDRDRRCRTDRQHHGAADAGLHRGPVPHGSGSITRDRSARRRDRPG